MCGLVTVLRGPVLSHFERRTIGRKNEDVVHERRKEQRKGKKRVTIRRFVVFLH